MRRRRKIIRALAVCALLCALAGCGAPEAEPTPSPAATPVAMPAPEPSATPSPAPLPTTPPDLEAAGTAAATPAPTPAPADDGRVTIADGFYYVALSDGIREKITGLSYPADASRAAITYDELRYIRLRYYDFEGGVHKDGELIVNAQVARDVTEIFYALYQAQYPFTSVWLVDTFGEIADDTLSMEANNTSAFCYRYTSGGKLSWHSFGAAIDINPLYNPYIDGGRVAPESGAAYADRTLGLPGMIDRDDLCYRLFTDNGWKWGGDWKGDKDWQHFYIELDYDRNWPET